MKKKETRRKTNDRCSKMVEFSFLNHKLRAFLQRNHFSEQKEFSHLVFCPCHLVSSHWMGAQVVEEKERKKEWNATGFTPMQEPSTPPFHQQRTLLIFGSQKWVRWHYSLKIAPDATAKAIFLPFAKQQSTIAVAARQNSDFNPQ